MATEPNRTEIIHENQNNFKQNKILQLKQLFPEIFCEEQIDFEKLKLVLGEDNLCAQNERYQLNWAGKSDAYRTLQSPTFNTLAPCVAESVNFHDTQNVFIEAENLEALKILQKSYAGKVKMIYIDPPYNTGNDSFIYPDKFAETRDEYAKRVGDKDQDGYLLRDGAFAGAWRKNSKDNGHYHSNWLSMMLPRLHLAKTLLREDGVIFISIDDNEQAQLKLLCDEVFGAENFLGEIVWRNVTDNNPTNIATEHEFIFTYSKNRQDIDSIWKSSFSDIKENLVSIGKEILRQAKNIEDAQKQYQIWFKENKYQLGKLDRYKYIDEEGIYTGSQSVHNPGKEGYRYDVIHPETGLPCKQPLMGYRFPKDTMDLLLENGKILFGKDHNKIIELKVYASDFMDKLSSVFDLDGRVGAYDLKELFSASQLFTNPKPIELLSHIFSFAVGKNDLILDFFSGSGTTAHAVMQLNAEDGGNRRYICVQLPEETAENSEARKAGFANIAEIAKERIRRAGAQIRRSGINAQQNMPSENADTAADAVSGINARPTVDTGFKVFKLTESHFKQWRRPLSGSLNEQQQLALLEEFQNIVHEHADVENMAYELMLRLGFELTDSIEFADNVVWLNNAAQTRKTALLLDTVNQAVLDEVRAQSPKKVFVLDKAFAGDDALKTNAALQFKDANIDFETL